MAQKVSCLFMGISLFFLTVSAFGQTHPESYEVINGPYLRWYRGNDGHIDIYGTILEVFDRQPNKPASKPDFKLFYKGLSITKISNWTAPQRRNAPEGFLLALVYGMGSTIHYSIIAKVKGHYKEVLMVDNGYAWHERPLEVVDLDGDSLPELISRDNYREKNGTARIWKWFEEPGEYREVRVCSYKDRLKPLSTREKDRSQKSKHPSV